MPKRLTEDQVRDRARDILGIENRDNASCGVGQLTTFNQLGFSGIADKPDGWYLPNNHADVAVVLETKASRVVLGDKQVAELLKNVKIVQTQYEKVVGILYNGDNVRVFMGIDEKDDASQSLQNLQYYLGLFRTNVFVSKGMTYMERQDGSILRNIFHIRCPKNPLRFMKKISERQPWII